MHGVLNILGKKMEVEEVIQEIKKDELYYRISAGGVTASGGEPLFQVDFLEALFKRCQQIGISTCLDTSAYSSAQALERVLKYTEIVLVDLKLIDRIAHRRVTKVSNERILRNIELIARSGISTIIRVPLIPTINDFEVNLVETVSFVSRLNSSKMEVNLLPYHTFGVSKYRMLDRPYKLSGLTALKEEETEKVKKLFEASGLSCEIIR